MIEDIKQTAKQLAVSFTVLAGLFLFVTFVSAWTGPTSAPPGCTSGNPGCDAPLNVGSTPQTKAGEVRVTLGTGYGQFRMVGGSYGTFWRNDGGNTYLLMTNSGDQNGPWNSLRPLYIDNVSGAVTIGTQLSTTDVWLSNAGRWASQPAAGTAVVAGGNCMSGVTNLWDGKALAWGGATCVGSPATGAATNTVTCPAGTTKRIVFQLTNFGRGGEGVICTN